MISTEKKQVADRRIVWKLPDKTEINPNTDLMWHHENQWEKTKRSDATVLYSRKDDLSDSTQTEGVKTQPFAETLSIVFT